jgi:hypothetical protein
VRRLSGRFAIKRLTHSDLTFFRRYYESQGENPSKQKAINLNADVFVDRLYKHAPEYARAHDGRIEVILRIYGPRSASEYELTRKIVKRQGYKNWRLDGELIDDPEGERDRFSSLAPDDLAVFEFVDRPGETFPVPGEVVMVLVSRDHPAYGVLSGELGSGSMCEVSPSRMEKLLRELKLGEGDPLSVLLDSVDMPEAAAAGDVHGIWNRRGARGIQRRMSRAELEAAKKSAEEDGELGERFVEGWLRGERAAGRISRYEWVSSHNAASPWDFEVWLQDGVRVRVEVKSTRFGFEREIYLSAQEIRVLAGDYDGPAWLCRVYGMERDRASLRVCRTPREALREVLDQLRRFPDGCRVATVAIRPDRFTFDESAIQLSLSEEPEAGDGES